MVEDIMLFKLSSITDPDILLDDGTPQGAAFAWLLEYHANRTLLDHVVTDDALVEAYALAVLYYSTNGDQWHNNLNWLTVQSHNNVCNWYGVYCKCDGCPDPGEWWDEDCEDSCRVDEINARKYTGVLSFKVKHSK